VFSCKPDFDAVLARYEAWWHGAVLDRPPVSITYPRPPGAAAPRRASRQYGSLRERWLDTERVVADAEAQMAATCFFADALPVAWPNLGPEVFSAFYGCPLEFGETTSWSVPVLASWQDDEVARLRLDWSNPYLRKLVEMTDALLEAARGRFIVGYTDMHPGGDAIAAFRDPQQLCVDLLEARPAVSALLERVTTDFLAVYDFFHERLSAAGMPSTTWLPATGRGRYHVPSNDFSCMISERLFVEVFLPGIVRECQHMDRCIYHLDGPQALRFLDLLLEIPSIQAIQWVPGAGRDRWSDWLDVYRRIQARGKAFCLPLPAAELDQVCQALRPEGVWLQLGGVRDEDAARNVLRRLERWIRTDSR